MLVLGLPIREENTRNKKPSSRASGLINIHLSAIAFYVCSFMIGLPLRMIFSSSNHLPKNFMTALFFISFYDSINVTNKENVIFPRVHHTLPKKA